MRGRLLPLLIFAALVSCSREFPEGGRHYQSEKRLLGDWTLVQFTADGTDSLGNLDPRIVAPEALHIYDGAAHHKIEAIVPVLKIDNFSSYAITFKEQKRHISFFSTSVVYEWPFLIQPNDWEVLKLTDNEVKLRLVGVKEYILDMQK